AQPPAPERHVDREPQHGDAPEPDPVGVRERTDLAVAKFWRRRGTALGGLRALLARATCCMDGSQPSSLARAFAARGSRSHVLPSLARCPTRRCAFIRAAQEKKF